MVDSKYIDCREQVRIRIWGTCEIIRIRIPEAPTGNRDVIPVSASTDVNKNYEFIPGGHRSLYANLDQIGQF